MSAKIHIQGFKYRAVCKTQIGRTMNALVMVPVQDFMSVDADRRCTRCEKRYSVLKSMHDKKSIAE